VRWRKNTRCMPICAIASTTGATGMLGGHTYQGRLRRKNPPARRRENQQPSSHLNCGIGGTDMRGGGSGANLEAFAIPLGSTVALFMPPTLAGPGGIPLTGTLPMPASPAVLANEAAGKRTRRTARMIFAEALDITKLQ
jgi:hypothetical protein